MTILNTCLENCLAAGLLKIILTNAKKKVFVLMRKQFQLHKYLKAKDKNTNKENLSKANLHIAVKNKKKSLTFPIKTKKQESLNYSLI